MSIKLCFRTIVSNISINSCFWCIFKQKFPKRLKNIKILARKEKKANKCPQKYFWQAKSAVERPFGHLSFENFVKMTFFRPKNVKKANKWEKMYFWPAKSAVERPFGHLSFGNFVKTVFFRIIFIEFVKKTGFWIFFGIRYKV